MFLRFEVCSNDEFRLQRVFRWWLLKAELHPVQESPRLRRCPGLGVPSGCLSRGQWEETRPRDCSRWRLAEPRFRQEPWLESCSRLPVKPRCSGACEPGSLLRAASHRRAPARRQRPLPLPVPAIPFSFPGRVNKPSVQMELCMPMLINKVIIVHKSPHLLKKRG